MISFAEVTGVRGMIGILFIRKEDIGPFQQSKYELMREWKRNDAPQRKIETVEIA